ncbi:putative BTB/POZ protein [Seiridium cardinale]
MASTEGQKGIDEAVEQAADRKLFESGLFTDVQIICGNKTWNLHRNILASRCIWFEKALSGNFEEATTRTITITTFNAESIGQLLEFIYTGA